MKYWWIIDEEMVGSLVLISILEVPGTETSPDRDMYMWSRSDNSHTNCVASFACMWRFPRFQSDLSVPVAVIHYKLEFSYLQYPWAVEEKWIAGRNDLDLTIHVHFSNTLYRHAFCWEIAPAHTSFAFVNGGFMNVCLFVGTENVIHDL